MKKITTFVLFALTLILSSTSQINAQKHGIAFRSNRLNFITPRVDYGRDLSDINIGNIYRTVDDRSVELAYYRYLGDRTAVSIPVKMGLGRVPTRTYDEGRRQLVGNADFLMQHSLFKHGRFILNPYVHYGIGGQYLNHLDDWDLNIPMGLGINIKIAEDVYLNAQTQYRVSTDKHHSYQHGVGLLFNFGDLTPKVVDRDGDGVLDINDQCPDVAGPVALMGCPDMDSDGIADKDDKCPEVLGIAALMGCPDKDGDGIADADDACPDQKGLAAFNGCPDTDGDGIQDKDDACPREKGIASLRGCPDTDGDGIADKDDACPREKGTVENKGCPVSDRDKDGIADKDDACPDKAGTAAGKGCPDTDGDGVYDNDDRCVTKPGPASNKGCPEIKQEDKVKLQNVIKNVQFETGSDKLLTKSYAVLDEVVSIMNQYPEYSLTISGHTDNVGDEAKNLDLSKRRAKTCYDYLVGKSVAASRMTHDGYGETRPVADNATKTGRDANRRVDFDLSVK